MRVDYGLFNGDDLIQRNFLVVTPEEQVEESSNVTIRHRLSGGAAAIVIEVFSEGVRLIESVLDMPIHESDDWESIELAQFAFAFKCRLDA